MTSRKFLALLVYTILILLAGRNISFLPDFSQTDVKAQTEHKGLKKEIQEIISSQQGTYSVSFLDLKTGNFFSINEAQMHRVASVNKVPIVAVLYSLASQGKINLEEQVTIQKEDIEDYGTGSIRYTGGGVYSLKTLAKLALSESDNTAAKVISDRIGGPAFVQEKINSWGLTQTNMEENQSSLSDMKLLFVKIAKGELINSSLSSEFLGFMRDTTIEDRLPLLLPESAKVFHKTGDSVGSVHDVGIIEDGDELFFIGIFTSDVGGAEEKTKETMGVITQKVLNEVKKYQ